MRSVRLWLAAFGWMTVWPSVVLPADCVSLCGRLWQLRVSYGDKLLDGGGGPDVVRDSDAVRAYRALQTRSMGFWPPEPLLTVSGTLVENAPEDGCDGMLFAVAADNAVTSPASGFVRISTVNGKRSIAMRTEAPLEVTVSGAFEISVVEGHFVLSGEELGRTGSQEANICVEAREANGSSVELRAWMMHR